MIQAIHDAVPVQVSQSGQTVLPPLTVLQHAAAVQLFVVHMGILRMDQEDLVFELEDVLVWINALPDKVGRVVAQANAVAVQLFKQGLPHIRAGGDVSHHGAVLPTKANIIFFGFLQKDFGQLNAGGKAFFGLESHTNECVFGHAGRTDDFIDP